MSGLKVLIYNRDIVGYRFETPIGSYDVCKDLLPSYSGRQFGGYINLYKSSGKLISGEDDFIRQIDNDCYLLKMVRSLVGDTSSGVDIFMGDTLRGSIPKEVVSMNSRYCLSEMHDCLTTNRNVNFLVLFGLRRSGKTVLIQQEIVRLLGEGVSQDEIAYITVRGKKSVSSEELRDFISLLIDRGIRYLFIDEVTFVSGNLDFLAGYSRVGGNFKIVLSGTYSAGLLQVSVHPLFDRADVINTTYISYEEYEMLYPGSTLIDYINAGAILTNSKAYDKYHKGSIFTKILGKSKGYYETAIVDNILHCFENYDFSTRYNLLSKMYLSEPGKLMGMLIRWLQYYGNDLSLGMLDRIFKPDDAGNLVEIVSRVSTESKIPLFKDRLYSLIRDEWSIDSAYSYSQGEIGELQDLMYRMGLLIKKTYKGNTYIMPLLLRVGCAYDIANILYENYDSLVEGTGIGVSRSDMVSMVFASIQGALIESVYDIDLYIRGVENTKVYVGSGEVDLVIDSDYYEIKRSNTFRKGFCRWLLNKDIRDKGSLNVVGNFKEGTVSLSEVDALRDCNQTNTVIKALRSASVTKYDVHLLNVNRLLIKLTRGKEEVNKG